jgi:hypothetical protein
MKTGKNLFPLCTKKVYPTKSGNTVEARDQVLIGFLSPDERIFSIFFTNFSSTKGPFFSERDIYTSNKCKNIFLILYNQLTHKSEARNPKFETMLKFSKSK